MKKLIRKRTLLLILVCLCTGFLCAYKLFVAPKSTDHPWVIAKTNDTSKKIITKETLISEIKQQQKLITTEVKINEKVTIDNSWGNLDIFKKIQNINFVGKGIYTIDLSNINTNNIIIEGNNVNITIPKPTVESVTLDEDNTQYETTQNGLLRFGDIKLSADDSAIMRKNTIDKMKEKMLDKEYYEVALKQSEKAISNIVTPIINSLGNNYTVNINFK